MSKIQSSSVVLARLLRPQGRKGEVLADLLTDFPDRFQPGAKVFLESSEPRKLSPEASPMEIVSAWLPQGRNQGRIVLGFAGVCSIEAAERLAGFDVVVPSEDRLELTDGSAYIDDLVGCAVYNGDVLVGTVSDVQFMTTPDGRRRLEEMAPLLTVTIPSGEALIPFAKDFLVSMDIEARRISMRLPEGLLELNTKSDASSG